ncbi:MAG: LacI family DNA-binding transcriptional regulator [Rubrivivax sp.]
MTIRDVARAAGVHVSTVSRALAPGGPAGVSAEVAAAVKSAAVRLGYRPNRAASSLRSGRTHTIGVLLPDIANPLFPPILQGIEAHAAARGSVRAGGQRHRRGAGAGDCSACRRSASTA